LLLRQAQTGEQLKEIYMLVRSLRGLKLSDNSGQLSIPTIHKPATKPVFRKVDVGKGKRCAWDGGDCQVRALCTAAGIRYEDAWETLYRLQARYRTTGFNLAGYMDRCPKELGVIRRISFPAVKGKPRMTGAAFCRKYPKGDFILKMAHHVVAVEDGQLLDVWDCSQSCVYTAWELEGAKL
jgi:hypothetical protein